MTQTSYFWDGNSVGDAIQADYDQDDMNLYFSAAISSDEDGFIIPYVDNELEVTTPGTTDRAIQVASGEAFIKGFRYYNTTTETLYHDPNTSVSPRIDRVVLRISWAAQTIRLAILKGTPATTPSKPVLTQAWGTTWEISLGWIWLASGFSSISSVDVHDEREMLMTAEAIQQSFGQRNMFRNSEFLALVMSYKVSGDVGYHVSHWGPHEEDVEYDPEDDPPDWVSPRSRVVKGTVLQQTIPVKSNTTYVLQASIRPESGSVGVVRVVLDAGNIDRYVRTATWEKEIIRFTTGAAETDITIRFTYVTGGQVNIAQPSLVEGKVPGICQPEHEFLMFRWKYSVDRDDMPLYSDYFDYSVPSGSYDLTSVFRGIYANRSLRGLVVYARATDAEIAASTNPIYYGFLSKASGHSVLRCYMDDVNSDVGAYLQGVVPIVDDNLSWEQRSGGEGATTDSLQVYGTTVVGVIT